MAGAHMRFSFVVLLVCFFCAPGCQYSKVPPKSANVSSFLVTPPVSRAQAEAQSGRYVAVSHKVVVEVAEAEMQKAWESVSGLCASLRCEVITSSIADRAFDVPPKATLSLRLAPDDLKKLFDQLGRSGRVVSHTIDSVDKTSEVIDTEAQIKNLTGFRDSLRTMLARQSGSVKDLIEVERELTKVQSELDSRVIARRVLANETEKVLINISFEVAKSRLQTGAFGPLATAWNAAGEVLAVSVAALLTLVVAVLPWVVVLVPAVWLSVRLLRRFRRKRAAPPATAGPAA